MAETVINTFQGGMNQDSSFILQPDGTYRNLKNGMIISHDGNHYSIELSKGNKVLLTLPSRYHSNVNNYTSKDRVPSPIGFISFIDKLVVFLTNNESSTGGYGEIGLISFTKVQNDFTASYTPYYHHPNLNLSKVHGIEGFTFKETDKIERVYWTDNNNEPRVFDFKNPIFTDYISSGSLVNGTKYMVLQGVIRYNGANYGPSDDSDAAIQSVPYVNSNIFTAGATSTYTALSGSPKIIEYYPIELLDWQPNRLLGSIQFSEYGVGNKNCGSSIYFYRLSSSTSGIQTTWSYGSNPIHVGTENETVYLTSNNYRDFVGGGTPTTLRNSNRSVKVTVSNIDTNFDTIELCCAEYNQVKDVPYAINIVAKLGITGDEMTIEDPGLVSLGTVTISELTLFPASVLKCKTITTNKNYNLIANITEREEFELDLSAVSVTQIEYPMVAHGDITLCANGITIDDVSPTVSTNPSSGDIMPWSRWLVTDITGGNITYNATTYTLGEVIVGVADVTAITIPSGSQIRPCTTKNKYTAISDGKRRENAIELKTGFWDYKDPAVASHNKGYWSTEKYRFAFVGFDKKGNPFYAKHIDDYTFDDIPTKGGLLRKDRYQSAPDLYSYALNPSAINISNLNIPEDVMNQLSGFSIMRAERDARILTQGLLMQNVIDPAVGANRIMPLGTTITSSSVWGPFYTPLGDLCTCICPDWLVDYEFNKPFAQVNSYIEEAFWSDGSLVKTGNTDAVFNTKLFDCYKDSSSPRQMKLNSFANGQGYRGFNEYNGDGNILGDGRNFYNRWSPVNASFYDNSCSGGGSYTAVFAGCKKILILPNHFNHYGPTGQYNGGAPSPEYYINKKIVVNFLNGLDKANRYGGTTPAALANTLYMSTGHYQEINDTVKSETLNGTFSGGIYDGQNKYTFNNIEVFGGDCFTNLVDIGYGLYNEEFNNEAVPDGVPAAYSIWFPCESNSNYNLRRGNKGSVKGMYPESPYPSLAWNNGGPVPTVLEGYSYNDAYSSEGTSIKYPALPLNYNFSTKFEYRIRWAGLKYPGETYDSFRNFSIANYRDVDGQRGAINNLKSKDSKTFYWQNHSVGYVPILERQVVSGAASGDATQLGTTGVVDRYEELNTYFGNQHQFGLTETEYGFFWFDMRRRALCVMSGADVQEISLVKGLQVFFNNEFNEGGLYYPNSYSDIYNTNNSDIPEVPLMGFGIVGVYDPKFKMSYLCFKYKKEDVIDVVDGIINLESKDFTIGYNHVTNTIVGFYDDCPAIWHNHNDLVLSSNNAKSRKYYGDGMADTTFEIGDVIEVKDTTTIVNEGEYVCIAQVNIPSYPPTTPKNPLTVGNAYWVKLNDQSQVYIKTFGSDYLKFYGKVYNCELEMIVNPKTDVAVSFQNMQVKGIGPNFTDVECYTDDQSAVDSNIPTTSVFYRWVDKSWFSNFPLSSTGRLVDYYLRVKMIYKGYVTNPTVAKTDNKVIQWIKSFFVQKR
jgi:hypothetical protein